MKKVATFEKVSFEQFRKDVKDVFNSNNVLLHDAEYEAMYDNIKIPTRATSGSAGYDFCIPFSWGLDVDKDIKIPTGIRCVIEDGWFLSVVPRSSLGFKYYTRLANTLGIVDSDYAFADNEGHIFVKIRNEGDKPLLLDKGERFAQGIFIPYGVADDEEVTTTRRGGFGSTGKQ